MSVVVVGPRRCGGSGVSVDVSPPPPPPSSSVGRSSVVVVSSSSSSSSSVGRSVVELVKQ